MLPEDVRDRVMEEQEQLREKITKLATFVYDFSKIKNISDYELTLLIVKIMQSIIPIMMDMILLWRLYQLCFGHLF